MPAPWEVYAQQDDSRPPWQQYGGSNPPAPSTTSRVISDIAKSVKKGVEQLPGQTTGLADVLPALAFGSEGASPWVARPFTTLANKAGELTGFQPGKWAEQVQLSPEAQAAGQEIEQAWKSPDTTALDVAKAYATNPAYSANVIAQSLPGMLAGGVASRPIAAALSRVAPTMAAPIAGGVGEGLVQAGQQMQEGENLADQRRNATAALASGAIDAAIAAGAGRVANKLGFETAQTAMAGGGKTAARGPFARIAGGAADEALLQELPQSMQEQVWQNYAEGKPLTEDVLRQGVEGAIAGGVLGAATNVRGGKQEPAAPPPAAGLLTNAPAPLTVFPDGTVGSREDAEKYIASLPEGEQVAARAKLFGMGEQPAGVESDSTPSAQMGIDANAGPLSQAAALAVDSGAHAVQTARIADAQKQQDQGRGSEGGEAAQAVGTEPTNPLVSAAAASGDHAQAAGVEKTLPGDWQTFPPETNTLGVPRADMPQINPATHGPLTQFLTARGITHETGEVDPRSLKPTQAEYSPAKMQGAAERQGADRSVLVSSDGYVLDGHHQWMARYLDGQSIRAIKFNAPIAQLLQAAKEFPSATTSDETTRAATAATDSGAAVSGQPGGNTPAGGVAAQAGAQQGAQQTAGVGGANANAGVSAGVEQGAGAGAGGAARVEPATDRGQPKEVLGRAVGAGAGATAVPQAAKPVDSSAAPFRTKLQAIQAAKKAGAGHEAVPLPGGGFAVRKVEKPETVSGLQPLSVGRMPNTAEPVTVKDGVVHIGEHEAVSYESGEPVRVPEGANDATIRKALLDAGVLSSRQKFFGGEPEQAAPAEKPAKAPKEPKAKPQTSQLRAFLRDVGIAPKIHADVTGETSLFRSHARLPKTFRVGGLQIDKLTQAAHERGFLTDADMQDDVAASNKLLGMIQTELRGEKAVPVQDAEEAMRQQFEARMEDERQSASEYALSTEELTDTGYFNASKAVRNAVDTELSALYAEIDAKGLERETVLEDAAKIAENGSDHDYIAAVRQVLAEADTRAAGAGTANRVEDSGGAGEARGQAQGLSERFAAGAALSKQQRKQVLATLTDVYKTKRAPRELKGLDRNGNERYGYVHSPELFEKSDITGAMVRYHVTMPDGRLAHPSELFPDYTQADIDKAMLAQDAAEKQEAASQKDVEDRAAKYAAASPAEAEASFLARNKGFDLRDWRTGRDRSFVNFEKDGKFFATVDDDTALPSRLERAGWKRVATDLAGQAPNASQQAAEDERAAHAQREQQQRNTAPSEGEFKLSGSDREADKGNANGQTPLFRQSVESDSTRTHAADLRKALAEPIDKLKIPFALHDTVYAARKATGIDYIPFGAKGMYFDGKLHLIAESNASPLEAEETFWHEVNHAGIDRIYNSSAATRDYYDAMRGLMVQNANIREAARKWLDRYGVEDTEQRIAAGMSRERAQVRTKLQAIEEALSELAGKNAQIKGLPRFLAKVQALLRSIGLNRFADWLEGKTNAEALAIIYRAREAVTEQAAQQPEPQLQPAPAFRETEAKPRERTQQEQALIDLRKREAVLSKLEECLG